MNLQFTLCPAPGQERRLRNINSRNRFDAAGYDDPSHDDIKPLFEHTLSIPGWEKSLDPIS